MDKMEGLRNILDADDGVDGAVPKGDCMETKIKEAMVKDFRALYQPGFSANYEAEQMIRSIEIGIMQVDNLVALYDCKKEQ